MANIAVRQTEHKIDPIFTERWSPRAFQEKPVPEEKLMRLFEAARWAPSAFNHQPWRFILLTSQEDKERFYPCISEGNLAWCRKVPVLVLIISEINRDGAPNPSHSFDTGAAWGYLSLAATMEGLATHPMTGFDFHQARSILNIPDEYAIQALVAIGYQGSAEQLDEPLRQREFPKGRRPLDELLYAGRFGEPLRGESR